VKTRLVFWQRMLSHATAGLFGALASMPDVEVVVYYEDELEGARVRLGWQFAEHGLAVLEALPKKHFHGYIASILRRERDSVHIFCGSQRYPKITCALRESIKAGLRFGVMAEPPVNQEEGLKRILKNVYLRSLPIRQQPIAHASRFLLALTGPSDRSFERLGWTREKVFPFGYFLPSMDQGALEKTMISTPPEVVYGGQLARHKGLLVLIRALTLIKNRGILFRCCLYGDGPLKQELAKRILQSGLEECVFVKLAIQHDKFATVLHEATAYVAPGLGEPWGIAVNEAIQAGLPVIVSDGVCGGSALVGKGGCGVIVHSGDAEALATALERFLQSPKEQMSLRAKCHAYAPLLSPEVAARHFLDIVSYSQGIVAIRPIAPWWSGSCGEKDRNTSIEAQEPEQ
jgi:glycosyltransferase involved in cell wall biosynthesis